MPKPGKPSRNQDSVVYAREQQMLLPMGAHAGMHATARLSSLYRPCEKAHLSTEYGILGELDPELLGPRLTTPSAAIIAVLRRPMKTVAVVEMCCQFLNMWSASAE
ncbi:hypothetical protein INS49_010633 [Diaporthe citri]|uniref:uncharacterized protein n=1 Tax=Diaporthe citri TaxID=83186 RepID=UPI001C7EE6B7|nr:uncharacterized protein INS49_010633 [Diaporthe citri]KAG6362403.1 hypothetical protein INS49_010633 [Diaporthe citri]